MVLPISGYVFSTWSPLSCDASWINSTWNSDRDESSLGPNGRNDFVTSGSFSVWKKKECPVRILLVDRIGHSVQLAHISVDNSKNYLAFLWKKKIIDDSSYNAKKNAIIVQAIGITCIYTNQPKIYQDSQFLASSGFWSSSRRSQPMHLSLSGS